MGINIIRGIFVLLCILIGSVTYSKYEGIAGFSVIGAIIGIIVSAIGIMIELALKGICQVYQRRCYRRCNWINHGIPYFCAI